MTLVLDRDDLQALKMEDIIDAVEEGFKSHSQGNVHMPLRMAIRTSPDKSPIFKGMGAYLPNISALGIKMIVTPGKATGNSKVILHNPENGDILSILDGKSITGLRTGAATGIATKYLARKDSEVIGLFGTGSQAIFQIKALQCVKPIKKIKVFSRNNDRREKFCSYAEKELELDVEPVDTPEKAVKRTDVIVTCTTSKDPVFDDEHLGEGVHICGVGSYTPNARELPGKTILRSKLVVDSRESALNEPGDIVIPIKEGIIKQDHIYAELGEIIDGSKVGRKNDEEITVFKSVGVAHQDITAAFKAYEYCLQNKIGKHIEL